MNGDAGQPLRLHGTWQAWGFPHLTMLGNVLEASEVGSVVAQNQGRL